MSLVRTRTNNNKTGSNFRDERRLAIVVEQSKWSHFGILANERDTIGRSYPV